MSFSYAKKNNVALYHIKTVVSSVSGVPVLISSVDSDTKSLQNN